MKKIYLLLTLGICALLFTGCPYKSEVTIDTPTSVKIDTRMLGKWQQRNSEDVTYVVTKKDDNTYSILEKNKPQEGQKQSADDNKTYNAFLSDVDGTKFLNVCEVTTDSSKTYYFYKLEFNDETNGFSLYPVSDYITETFTASADLKKFIQQYKSLSFFFGTKDEYIKVGK
jgi:hypothetical protein